ncbi:MAG: invasion associated locus B family protein [Mangrovicoccus sp.]
MRRPIAGLLLLVASTIAAMPVSAQDTGADGGELSIGKPVEPQLGDRYVTEKIGDWDIRCVKTDRPSDPCQIYQLLTDASGTPTAEISIFKVSQTGVGAAGTIVTPLETLLTRGLTLSIDAATPRQYQFTFCSQIGCIAQVGFTPEETDAMKAGNAAEMVIVPAGSRDARVALSISLKGFTAAFDNLSPAQ